MPVPAVNEGIDALVQGRAEVSNHTVASAKIKEADAAIGVRFVSLDCSPQGEARLKKAVPGYYLTTLKAGALHRHHRRHLRAGLRHVPGRSQRAVERTSSRMRSKAIWDNVDKLAPLHPSLQEWTRERAIDRRRDHGLPSRRGAVLQRTAKPGPPRWTRSRRKCWR